MARREVFGNTSLDSPDCTIILIVSNNYPPPSMFAGILGSLSSSSASLYRRLRQINEGIATRLNISARRVVSVEIGVLVSFGFTMIQVDEYAAAVASWTVVGIIWLAKVGHWEIGNATKVSLTTKKI